MALLILGLWILLLETRAADKKRVARVVNKTLYHELRRLRELQELYMRNPDVYDVWSASPYDEVDVEIDRQIRSGYVNPGLLLLILQHQREKDSKQAA